MQLVFKLLSADPLMTEFGPRSH